MKIFLVRLILALVFSTIILKSCALGLEAWDLPFIYQGTEADFTLGEDQVAQIKSSVNFFAESDDIFLLDNGNETPVRGEARDLKPVTWEYPSYWSAEGKLTPGTYTPLRGWVKIHLTGEALNVLVYPQVEDISRLRLLSAMVAVIVLLIIWILSFSITIRLPERVEKRKRGE